MSDLEFSGGVEFSEALSNLDAFASEAQAKLADALSLDSFSATLSAAAADAFAAPIPVEADASAIPAQIDAALADSVAVIPVDADTTPAVGAVSDLVAGVDAEAASITVDADTTEAAAALDDLASSAAGAGSSLSGVSEHEKVLGLSTGQLAGVAGLAVGEVGSLREASSLLGERTAAATAGVLGLGVGIAELYHQGLAAVSAEERFTAALGDQAEAVQRVQVGNLDADLLHLGATFGSADAAMKNATTSVFQFAINSGASAPEARAFADGIAAISARAVATKPSVGDIADVMDRAAIGIGRARTAASLLNIGLSTTEVNTRAAAIAQQNGEESASAYDKSLAALQITVERFGPSLKENVEEGAKNAANQAKAAKAEFDNALESFGKPLVAPALDLIRDVIPVAEQLGSTLADVATVAIPLVSTALEVLGPLIGPVVEGFLALKAAELAAAALGLLANGAVALGIALPVVGDAALATAVEVETASLTIEAAAGPIGLLVGIAALAATQLGLFGGAEESVAEQTHKMAAELAKLSGGQLIRSFEGGATIRAFGDNISLSAAKLSQFRTIAEDNVGTAQRLLTALRANGENVDGYQKILDQSVTKQKAATQAEKESAASKEALLGPQQDQTAAVETYVKALDDEQKALDEIQNRLLGLPGAQLNQANAVRDQAQAQQEYNDALASGDQDKIAEASLRLQGANQSLAASTLALQAAQQDFNDIAQQSPAYIQAEIDKLIAAQSAGPAAAASLQPYIDALVAIRDRAVALQGLEATVTVHADISGALLALDTVRGQVLAAGGSPGAAYSSIDYAALGRFLGTGKASGGPVDAGTPYPVGEDGPEIFVPRVAGTIYNQAQIAASSGPAGRGEPSINIAKVVLEQATPNPTREAIAAAWQLRRGAAMAGLG